jgi:hypothetical protein
LQANNPGEVVDDVVLPSNPIAQGSTKLPFVNPASLAVVDCFEQAQQLLLVRDPSEQIVRRHGSGSPS